MMFGAPAGGRSRPSISALFRKLTPSMTTHCSVAGRPATEQCVVIDGVNFLNNADIDGRERPPAGAPNIMMAAGGTQLKNVLEDDGVYAWTFHVDWRAPAN